MQGSLTHINDENIGWETWFPESICSGRFEFIGAIHEFRPLLSVSSLPEFIESGLVINGYIVDEGAKIADGFGTVFNKLHIGIDVGFAPVTPEGSFFPVINQGNVLHFALVFVLIHLSERLDSESEGDTTGGLHGLILRSCNHIATHEFRSALPLVYCDERDTC